MRGRAGAVVFAGHEPINSIWRRSVHVPVHKRFGYQNGGCETVGVAGAQSTDL